MTDKPERLGDAPIQQKYIDQMNAIARALDDTLNGKARGKDKKVGFVLMLFEYTEPGENTGRCNYISNGANRKDVVTLMREMIARFEGQPEMTGHA